MGFSKSTGLLTVILLSMVRSEPRHPNIFQPVVLLDQQSQKRRNFAFTGLPEHHWSPSRNMTYKLYCIRYVGNQAGFSLLRCSSCFEDPLPLLSLKVSMLKEGLTLLSMDDGVLFQNALYTHEEVDRIQKGFINS